MAASLVDALPGDFALYPGASHVGMIVGRNEAGKLLICHCSYGLNNVAVTEFIASGYTNLGRQSLVSGYPSHCRIVLPVVLYQKPYFQYVTVPL